MKRIIISIWVALMATVAFAAELNNDTINAFRYKLPSDISQLTFEGYSTAVVVPDGDSYVCFAKPDAVSPKPVEFKQYGGTDMAITAAAGTPKMEVHLPLDLLKEFAIHLEDYCQVTMPALNFAKLKVVAEDYSLFVVDQNGRNQLSVNTLSLRAEDYAKINVMAPCVATSAKLIANDYATIKMSSGEGTKLEQARNVHATISIENNKYREIKSAAVENVDEGFNYDGYRVTRLKNTYKKIDSEFALGFSFAATNWGNTPFNGLSGMAGDNELDTKFSNYQIEAIYYPVVTSHLRMGLGMGYESAVYHFHCPNIMYASASDDISWVTGSYTPFLSGTPDAGDWSSRLVARYVTLPISFRYNTRKGFYLGVALIPGLNYDSHNTGLKHKAKYSFGATSKDCVDVEDLMNPYKMDARVTMGREHLYAFFQVATMSVFNYTDIYPIKLGFTIEL